MILTIKDFPTLTKDIQSIFDETKKTKLASSKGLELFGVADTNLLDYKHQVMHSIGGMSRVAEGQNYPSVSTSEGDSIYYTQLHYAGLVNITKESRMFWLERNGSVYDQAKNIMDTAWNQIDTSFAEKLIYGWSTSYTDVYGDTVNSNRTPDSLTLFNANHTTKINSTYTFSNLITDSLNAVTNPALSRQAIVDTRIRAMKFADTNGLVKEIDLDTIIIPPELLDKTEQILYSLNYPRLSGTANTENFAPNNINRTTPIGNMKIVTWSRLSKASVPYTSTMWFLANSTLLKESCKALFAQRPVLNAPEKVYENELWQYSIDAFYALGYGFPAYIYGSKGDNS